MTSVHLAFTDLDVDVISMIFAEFIGDVGDEDWSTYERDDTLLEGRRTLLSLALTSKTFLEPALNALWQKITDLGPLLQVLPEATQVDGTRMILGEVHPSSWERLLYYTSRTRVFFQSSDEQTRIHKSVYFRLGEVHKEIFPRLRRFDPGAKLARSGSIGFFIPKTLRSLTLPSRFTDSERDEDSDFGPFLSIIARDITNLEELQLGISSSSIAQISGLSWSLSRFRRLCILRIKGTLAQYEPGLLRTICTLPELSEISIKIPPSASLNYEIVENGFPSLRSLDLQASFSDAASFLKMIDPVFPSLVEFTHLSDSASPSIGDLALLTKALARFTGLKHLGLYNISATNMTGDASAHWSTFKPLLQLRKLGHLGYYYPVPVPEEDMVLVASAWPDITYLQLTSSIRHEHVQAVISINSLTHFAHHCRKLRTLHIPLRLEPLPKKLPPPTLFMHPLEELHVDTSDTIRSPFDVALRLDHIFPALQSIDGPLGFDYDFWYEVQHIIKDGLQVLRAQKETPGYERIMTSP